MTKENIKWGLVSRALGLHS